MNIVIGADHRGYAYKKLIKNKIAVHKNKSLDWVDVGAFSEERSDYPIFAQKAVEAMREQAIDRCVLICGSGIGMAVAANRFSGIYAGVVWNNEVARLSREHDNVNVLIIPSDFVTEDEALNIVHAWLEAEFLGGRYKLRIDLINAKE